MALPHADCAPTATELYCQVPTALVPPLWCTSIALAPPHVHCAPTASELRPCTANCRCTAQACPRRCWATRSRGSTCGPRSRPTRRPITRPSQSAAGRPRPTRGAGWLAAGVSLPVSHLSHVMHRLCLPADQWWAQAHGVPGSQIGRAAGAAPPHNQMTTRPYASRDQLKSTTTPCGACYVRLCAQAQLQGGSGRAHPAACRASGAHAWAGSLPGRHHVGARAAGEGGWLGWAGGWVGGGEGSTEGWHKVGGRLPPHR